jgi:hypothetical protein
MGSADRRITIERYLHYDDKGELVGVSFGCLSGDKCSRDLMGYTDIDELLEAVKAMLKEYWLDDKASGIR